MYISDLAYSQEESPRIAVEVLIGHGVCHIIAETSVHISVQDVRAAVHRIAGNLAINFVEVSQDSHLAANQTGHIRCGDNGISRTLSIMKPVPTIKFWYGSIQESWALAQFGLSMNGGVS